MFLKLSGSCSNLKIKFGEKKRVLIPFVFHERVLKIRFYDPLRVTEKGHKNEFSIRVK